MKLADPSSSIEYLRDAESDAGYRVEELLLGADAACCDRTSVELWYGARGARAKRELAALEKEVELFTVDARAWSIGRQLARRCREAGVTVPTADLVIAACAVAHKVELEHCDAHFDKILPIAARL